LHPPELQVPLLLHPRGIPPPDSQLEHPIVIFFSKITNIEDNCEYKKIKMICGAIPKMIWRRYS
jgi:hypothetical protein